MDLKLHVWRQAGPEAKGRMVTYEAKDISDHASFLEMLDCIMAGFRLGLLMEEAGEGDVPPLLVAYLDEAKVEFSQGGCRDGLVLAEWLQRPDVRGVAMGIHLAREGGAPESLLSAIEGMLDTAMNQYLAGRQEGAYAMVYSAQDRLEGLAEYVPEKTGLFAMFAGLYLLRRRKNGLRTWR